MLNIRDFFVKTKLEKIACLKTKIMYENAEICQKSALIKSSNK